jgi:hypothetical protein
MREKDFQKKFSKWLRYNNHINAVYELKLTKTGSLPFNAVKEHQINALQIARNYFMIYKIPDDTISQKPFDCFKICNCEAFVVVQFYKPRANHFYLIDVERFINERDTSPRKSLTEERAKIIGMICYFTDAAGLDIDLE